MGKGFGGLFTSRFLFSFLFSLSFFSFFAVILGVVCIHVLYRLAEITKDKYSIFFYVQTDLLGAWLSQRSNHHTYIYNSLHLLEENAYFL